MSDKATRFVQNPLITNSDIEPSHSGLIVEGVLNPGVFTFQDKIWLVLRVAERPLQKEGMVSFPVLKPDGSGMIILEFSKDDKRLDLSDPRLVKVENTTYLSSLSHFRLFCSEDGYHFYEPDFLPTKIFGKGQLETYGIEDCRVSQMDGVFYLTYTQVSQNGVGVGMMSTLDWKKFRRHGMVLPPHNKDCVLFEEKINGTYYCLHRPSGHDLGGNFVWISTSKDLENWGNHYCLLHTRVGMWDCERVGAGSTPIRTEKGWLVLYHGADFDNRYCMGAILLDIGNPKKIIGRTKDPIMEPETDYEKKGFFGNVVFVNGHLVKGDELTIYYGASDSVICGAKLSISDILSLIV